MNSIEEPQVSLRSLYMETYSRSQRKRELKAHFTDDEILHSILLLSIMMSKHEYSLNRNEVEYFFFSFAWHDEEEQEAERKTFSL